MKLLLRYAYDKNNNKPIMRRRDAIKNLGISIPGNPTTTVLNRNPEIMENYYKEPENSTVLNRNPEIVDNYFRRPNRKGVVSTKNGKPIVTGIPAQNQWTTLSNESGKISPSNNNRFRIPDPEATPIQQATTWPIVNGTAVPRNRRTTPSGPAPEPGGKGQRKKSWYSRFLNRTRTRKSNQPPSSPPSPPPQPPQQQKTENSPSSSPPPPSYIDTLQKEKEELKRKLDELNTELNIEFNKL